jgi:hypothetical protein
VTEDDLDPTLAALLAHEADAPAVEPARLAKIRARSEAAFVAPTLADRTTARSATKELLRLGGVLAIGAALGAAGYALLGPKPMQPTVPTESRAPIGTAPSPDQVSPLPATVLVQPEPAPSTTAPTRVLVPTRPSAASPLTSNLGAETPPTPPAPSTSLGATARPATVLDEERGLVEQGRVAFSRRDWLSSLEAVRAHRQRFPNGQLAEERDALEVQALAAGGHSADARRKGEAFLSAYPQSMLRGRIDALLRELPK